MTKSKSSSKPTVTLAGKVEKIIPPAYRGEPEKAQIVVEGAEDLYREIRIDNALEGASGAPVKLKQGAEVAVTIEAETAATVPQ